MTDNKHPPTIIVVHPKERPAKCTVRPLRNRDGFLFWTFPNQGPQSLENYVRLGLEGPRLSPADAERGLLVLDGTWRRVEAMEQDYQHVPVRSLPRWKTAYPRHSKLFVDPPNGLATIEALYIAYRILGRNVQGLLDSYRWAETFLTINGIEPVEDRQG